jgi:hypothetical protein
MNRLLFCSCALILALVDACDSPTAARKPTPASPPIVAVEVDSANKKSGSLPVELENPQDDEDGPPFKRECPCDFASLGISVPKAGEYNQYISGTGWDANLPSCTWIWGEYINNEFPPDTTTQVFRIYLLNLPNATAPPRGGYAAKILEKHTLALYVRDSKAGTDTCIYAPDTGRALPAGR